MDAKEEEDSRRVSSIKHQTESGAFEESLLSDDDNDEEFL